MGKAEWRRNVGGGGGGGGGTLVPYHRALPLWSQPAPGSLSVFFKRGRWRGREG